MKRVLLLTGLGLLVASTAMADIVNVRFAMHRKPKFEATKTVPNRCDNPATETVEINYSPNYDNIACTEYTVTGPAPGSSELYIVVGEADPIGVAAASFGIDYDGRTGQMNGVDPAFTAWAACADGLGFPNDGGFGDFPNPKGGIRITWTLPESCADQLVGGKVHAVVGAVYVYAYAEDVVRITPNNNLQSGPELAWADCTGASFNVLETLNDFGLDPALIMGRVHLGGDGSQGYTPCGVIATQPTTWGKIKSFYKD